jgi:hypothetical protein
MYDLASSIRQGKRTPEGTCASFELFHEFHVPRNRVRRVICVVHERVLTKYSSAMARVAPRDGRMTESRFDFWVELIGRSDNAGSG